MPINDQLAQRLTEQTASTAPLTREQRAGQVKAAPFFDEFNRLGLIDFSSLDSGPTNAVSNARASRSSALKQLGIQRKKLEFQKKTGLRDISQARTKGLRGAINNALQRGIFNSGIRTANEAEVNRESDEAAGDLKTNIQFALDDLAARREGVAAGRFGDASTGGLTPPLSIEQAGFQSQEQAKAERERILSGPQTGPGVITQDPKIRDTNTGVIQQPRQGGVQ